MRSELKREMRKRARELRALADEVADPRVKRSLLRTAEACERFAEREEKLAGTV
jgi:hypothetical protein